MRRSSSIGAPRFVPRTVAVSCVLTFLLLLFLFQKKSAVKQLASQIHEKALPFIKWLKEAEEEDSEDDEEEDDEDDDVEVVYDERSRPDKIMEVKEEPKVSPKKVIVAKKEDDIDIDAI